MENKGITVKDVIEILKHYPQDYLFSITGDYEVNEEIENGVIKDKTTLIENLVIYTKSKTTFLPDEDTNQSDKDINIKIVSLYVGF